MRKAEEACPVGLETYASYDEFAGWILCVRGMVISVGQWETLAVTADQLQDIKWSKVIEAQKWCERHSIPWSDPGWLLCSIYG